MVERKTTYFDADGIRRTLITDHERPGIVVQTEQNIGEIVESIKRDQETMRHGVNKLAARLPTFVYEDLVARGIAGDEDRFKAWLNGPEAAPWRIWQGSV